MILKPVCIGTSQLRDDILKEDARRCLRIGPCGLGEKALYIGSLFLERRCYIRYSDISRCFKRVAMSKGGFTGKGMFGSIAYLVVLTRSGEEHQCSFKFEDEVDLFLAQLKTAHPDIRLHSEEAERKLKEAEAKERARYLDKLSPEQDAAVRDLTAAEHVLRRHPVQYTQLAHAARQKRIIDHISPTYRLAAMVVFGLAVAAALFGVYSIVQGMGGAVYFVLFGIAAIFAVVSSRILPTGRNNRKAAQEDWESALQAMAKIVDEESAGRQTFPVPAQYAHPVVLERMIRVVREGRASSAAEALAVEKEDLRKLNYTVEVSQKEHDEVVMVKPMFLVMNYE